MFCDVMKESNPWMELNVVSSECLVLLLHYGVRKGVKCSVMGTMCGDCGEKFIVFQSQRLGGPAAVFVLMKRLHSSRVFTVSDL